jgi:REP element-mobilizing transposase RayT
MDRYWLLTSTFYGNWLPGDSRGFVARVRDRRPEEPPESARREHDLPGTPYDKDMRGLKEAARNRLKGSPVWLTSDQAAAVLAQFQQTAQYRGWRLLAAAVMANHVHLVVGVRGDPDPTKILGDFKAYASRALNARWGKPPSGTWWTYAGSKRKLPDEHAVLAAVHYVRRQPQPLAVWSAEEYLE